MQDWRALLASGALVAGVDEAGRGPLAGEVVAAAVILPAGALIEGLRDSKLIPHRRHAEVAGRVRDAALACALASASVEEIDRLNILQASLLAMHRAVDALPVRPDWVIVDGNRLPAWDYRAIAVVGGDALVPAVSAASVLAKQRRDADLVALDAVYPGYGFAVHKGYPTAAHLAALRALGPCAAHRRSFAPVRALIAQCMLAPAETSA